MINKPRISKWIGIMYLLITIMIAVLFVSIALGTDIFSVIYAGILFTAVMLAALVLLGIVTYGFYKTSYTIKDGRMYSWSPFAVINLNVKEIKKAELTRIPFYFKGFGASLYSGIFFIPGLGWTKVIITNLTDGVLMTDKSGKNYLITPSNPEGFAKSLKSG